MFLEKKNLVYVRFNLYWLVEIYDCKDNYIFIVVRKDLLIKTILENQTDQVRHPYGIVLDIKKVEIHAKWQMRKSRIVNVYNNKVVERQTWQGSEQRIR